MREYLFRGKRIDNGEWVEGFCVRVGNVHYIFTGKICFGQGYADFDRHKVIPETVGQYGLNDKNGVKIFEGDIVVCNRQINDVFDKKTFLVGEISPISGLIGKSLSGNEICGYEWEFAEVIGNIYDNPELLEEGGV